MDAGRHPNIEILTLSQVTGLSGRAGDFRATVVSQPRFVKLDRCTGCGDCAMACPQTSRNEWDLGLAARKAIYRPYPQAVPSAYVIDISTCLNTPTHLVCERCRRVCKREAIEHDMQPTTRRLNVGSVIVATGFDEFHPHVMKSYGYGVWQNVMTSLEFERLLNASGPTQGHVIRPSDRKEPKNLAFIQCVGARGEGGRPNCSRYCCMNAVKDALLYRQHQPEVESCTILYTDIRAFGKGFDAFVERAEGEDYIHFVRGRPSKLMEVENDDIEIFVEDTEIRRQLRLRSDMVVLSCAGVPRDETADLANALGVQTNAIGFFAAASADHPVETNREGVFLCGSAGGPHVIPECVAQASAAAAKAACYVRGFEMPEIRPPEPEPIDPAAPPRVGVFVCRCGANIGRIIQTEQLAEEAAKLPGVVHASVELFACADTGQKSIQEKIAEYKINRVVVAACTPRTHEPVFRQACLGAGLNPYLLEMANIRDQCSWVHSKSRDKAYGKALDLVRMAVARSKQLQPLEVIGVEITKHAVVIGGGIAGLRAAIDLDRLGIGVTLIESSDKLGGRVHALHATFPSNRSSATPASELLEALKKSKIRVLLNTKVKAVTGYVGSFEVHLDPSGKGDGIPPVKAGAIIVAIGSALHVPGKEWRYGEAPNVISSMDLERILKDGDPDKVLAGAKRAVFLQCVGSRHPEHGYSGCSRYCCPATCKQASELKARGIDSVVLYRDMRMVGHGAEEYYREVRHDGVLFLRYDPKHPPELIGDGCVEKVTFTDTLLDKTVSIPADLVILAVGMENPIEYSEELRTLLKIPRGSDGFFLERHPELGPVETCIDGVFLCGTIQGPKDISDSVVQASASAGKVAELLSRETIYLEPVVCEVQPELCRACGECVEICEYHALQMTVDETGRQVAQINRALCKGCGTCAVWCPTTAIRACHFTDAQITSMIETLFEEYHV
ncbi:FAD-dependent oxidoreductase [bacterium]|nr:FAD-dependent oxidoreductase [bacterium]MBU1984258.1 FAD-dependent oxidoreductase [bacterium]